jgi:predicted membrane metal-binding protein
VTLNLTHFEVSVVFALVSSAVMGVVTKKTDQERLRYGLQCFAYFVVALFGIGWVMHFLHG